MSLQIIGAGFGRTGTLSVKLALEQLGFGPCYHMMEVFHRPPHIELWNRARRGEKVDWEALFAGFTSAVDWPAAYFWRELVQVYPQARVLLTVRDPDAWYESARETVLRVDPSIATTDVGRAQLAMAGRIVSEGTFGGRVDDRAHCIDVYLRHNTQVQRALGERVLTYDVADGWGPLCAWLGVAVPDGPFPRTNSTAEFQQRLGLEKR
jgi:hypothetical protein